MEEGEPKLTKERLKAKLDRTQGEPKPDASELLKADLDAVAQLDRAEKAANKAAGQRAAAERETDLTNTVIDTLKGILKRK